MTPLNKRYPDLLGEQNDPELEHLVTDLETMFQVYTTESIPPQSDAAIAQALRERARARSQQTVTAHRYQSRVRIPRRMVLLAVALVSVLVLAGTVLAGIPLVDQALRWYDARMQQTAHHPLGQVVNLSQKACGFTMTLQRVYADANDVIIGYTIKAPSARRFIGAFNVQPAHLIDAQGSVYPAMGGGGVGGADNETGNVMQFDAGGTTNHPYMLKLHLAVPVITTNEQIDDISHTFAACETYRPLKKDEVPQSLDYTKLRAVMINGPFNFDFSVPFAGGREVDVQQVVESGGTRVTLERVVVTPIETRFYVLGVTQATDVNLVINGQTMEVSGSLSPSDGLVIYIFDTVSLYDQHGGWKVVISARPDLAKVTRGGAPVGGPWTFSFRMP